MTTTKYHTASYSPIYQSSAVTANTVVARERCSEKITTSPGNGNLASTQLTFNWYSAWCSDLFWMYSDLQNLNSVAVLTLAEFHRESACFKHRKI